MTRKEKKLLLKDLCARLPYTPMVNIHSRVGYDRKLVSVNRHYTRFGFKIVVNSDDNEDYMPHNFEIEEIKPYLRPMSSMTRKEKETYLMFFDEDGLLNTSVDTYMDWLLERHFDFRGLIPMGLALEAPEDMYKNF